MPGNPFQSFGTHFRRLRLTGAAVNVTRTLSLDGKDWEAVLQKSATHTLPPRRSQIGANDPDQDLPSQPHK